MGRPSKFDRDAAVDVAMNAFWRHGYEACSVKALSEELGITRSSFYNAFGSREALFREALARYFEQTPDRALAPAGLGAGTPTETGAERGLGIRPLISRIFREACRVRAADPEARGCLAVNCLAELCAMDGDLSAFMEQACLDGLDRIRQLLTAARASGEIPATADPHALALSIKTLLIGLNMLSRVVRDEDELWLTAQTGLRGMGLLEE